MSRSIWLLLLPSLLGVPGAVYGQATTRPAVNPSADEMLTFTFPENIELKVLINYVGERQRLQFFYDDAVGQQRVTIKQGARIPQKKLLDFLQMILQSRNLAMVDMDQPGWVRIVSVAAPLTNVGSPTTLPVALVGPGVVTQVFPLHMLDAGRMEAVIKPFLTQPGGAAVGIPEQRLLIVTDYASNFKRIAQLVDMLDQVRREVIVQFVSLKYSEAQDIAPKVTQVMQGEINTAGVANPAQIGMVEIGFDQRTNQIAIVGSKDRVDDAIAVVKQFDTPSDLVTKTYHFDFASPEQVDKLMRQMLDPVVAKRIYQSGVDKAARLLVVTGTEEIHKTIDNLKKSLDAAMATSASPIQFYKLSNATASDVLETIRSIQGDEGERGESGGEREHPKGRANPLAGRHNSSYGAGGSNSNDQSMPQAGSRRLGNVGGESGGNGQSAQSGEPTTRGSASAGPGKRSSFQTEGATVTADPNTNSIIVVADPAAQKVYEQLIRMLDKRRPQVLIECTLVTLDTSKNFQLAVDVGIHGGVDNTDLIAFSSFGVSRPKTDASGAATGRLALVPGLQGFNGALLNSDVADIVVNALETSGRARVMSAPRILVNDNATGSLLSTAEQPYADINIGNTVSTTSFGGYVEAGTSIDLTPHISEANYLQLEYQVSLNRFSGTGSNGIPPPRQTSALTSTVTIPDGSTIIIGGLNASNSISNLRKVPILGDIPLLEYLFSSRDSSDTQSTLFVFIRPIILRDDQFQDLKFLSEKDVRSAGLASDDPVSEPLVIK